MLKRGFRRIVWLLKPTTPSAGAGADAQVPTQRLSLGMTIFAFSHSSCGAAAFSWHREVEPTIGRSDADAGCCLADARLFPELRSPPFERRLEILFLHYAAEFLADIGLDCIQRDKRVHASLQCRAETTNLRAAIDHALAPT